MKGPLLAIGALLVVAGGAALGYGVTRKPAGGMTPQASQAMSSAINQLDGDVKAARATVKERAATLSTLQQVQAAAATDAATAKDMLEKGELAFTLQPGEVIELGQIKKGEPAHVLLLQPDGAMKSPHAGNPGSYTDLMGDSLAVMEVAPVKPREMAEDLTGYISVTRPLNLRPAIDKLQAAGVNGRIDIGAQNVAIGSPPSANAETQAMPLPSLPDAKLVATIPAKSGGMPLPLVAGGGVAAGLGLLLIVLGMMGGKTTAAAPVAASPQTTGIGTANTQISQPGINTVPNTTPYPDAGGSMTTNLQAGSMVGRWEIIKRLGSGGMADVYLARARGEAGFEKTVAVKVMHPHLARNQRAVDHFLDEARLASRITHPNVVAIQDLGKIGNDYVIVMEYSEGVDL